MKANPRRDLAFSENWQSLCRINVAPASADEADSCQYLKLWDADQNTSGLAKNLDRILKSGKTEIGLTCQQDHFFLKPFDDHRDTLTATDAGRRETVTLITTMKFVQHG